MLAPRVFALGFVLLAGCYAQHAPWERAAPDGSAIWMRVELSGGRAAGGGFLQVRFDGTYVASPMNELRVCTGTLAHGELDVWIALIERTDAFAREGNQGNVIDGGRTEVRLWSEGGLSTRFTLLGGPAFGQYDPALAGFTDAVEAFWQTLDLASCAPVALDPATSSLGTWIDALESSREGGVRIEVARDGAVRALFAPGALWSFDDELAPCTPLADAESFWATVLAAAPFEPHPAIWRRSSGTISAEVTAADGTTHRRWVHYHLDPSRPEQAWLEEALLTLAQNHCTP